ncbi:MAG: hypothetical protein M3Y59_02400 [Myxococcota bacterium]|nr:hypothetical protein [Myxococcota bacterium]
MTGQRQDRTGGPVKLPEAVGDETLQADAFPVGTTDSPEALIAVHRRTADRLLRDGSAQKAFSELVVASRSVPMNAALAAGLTFSSLRAGTESAAITLLISGVEDTDGADRIAVRRQLIRLLRRGQELEAAREQLVLILAEKPGDRRARRTLTLLLAVEKRWEELDASLEKETREALKAHRLRAAARATLQRARVWADHLDNPAHAAIRFAQAAQYLEQEQQFQPALEIRLQWLESLSRANAPRGAVEEALKATVEAGARVGEEERVRATAKRLGLILEPLPVETWREPGTAALPVEAPRVTLPTVSWESSRPTLAEVPAVSSLESRKTTLEEVPLQKAPRAPLDPAAFRKQEAQFVARGAWRELAAFYGQNAVSAGSSAQRAECLSRMAEVLEDELGDLLGAAKAYGELSRLTGDKRALDEQVRLLNNLETVSGVKRVLDDAVENATDEAGRSSALVTRGEAALIREDYAKARQDFQTALGLTPGALVALAGVAEAAAAQGDLQPVEALREALVSRGRLERGRTELFRRLARVAERYVPDLELARLAWSEVLADVSVDPEAQDHLATIARKLDDLGSLDHVLRAKIRRDPRGANAKALRLELVAVLKRDGRPEESMEQLMQAVRFDPGHREAWLLLVERYLAQPDDGRAAWAMEHAATATEDEVARAALWERLALHCRQRLHDEGRAKTYATRAAGLRSSGTPAADPLAIGAGQPMTSSPVLSKLPRAVANTRPLSWENSDPGFIPPPSLRAPGSAETRIGPAPPPPPVAARPSPAALPVVPISAVPTDKVPAQTRPPAEAARELSTRSLLNPEEWAGAPARVEVKSSLPAAPPPPSSRVETKDAVPVVSFPPGRSSRAETAPLSVPSASVDGAANPASKVEGPAVSPESSAQASSVETADHEGPAEGSALQASSVETADHEGPAEGSALQASSVETAGHQEPAEGSALQASSVETAGQAESAERLALQTSSAEAVDQEGPAENPALPTSPAEAVDHEGPAENPALPTSPAEAAVPTGGSARLPSSAATAASGESTDDSAPAGSPPAPSLASAAPPDGNLASPAEITEQPSLPEDTGPSEGAEASGTDNSAEAARLLKSIIEGLNTEAEHAVLTDRAAPAAPSAPSSVGAPTGSVESFDLFGEAALPVLPPPPAQKPSLPRPTLEVLVKIPPEARKDTREAEVVIPPEARRPTQMAVSAPPPRIVPDSPPTEAELPFSVAGELLGSPGREARRAPSVAPPVTRAPVLSPEPPTSPSRDRALDSAPTLAIPLAELAAQMEPKVSLPVSPQDLMLERLSGAIERYEAASEARTRGPRTEEFEIPSFRPPDEEQKLPDDEQRAALFSQVRDNPLDADAYHLLADYFDRHGDVERGDLMAEIATALEAVPEAPARVPRLILSARDRSGLRHPQLRGEAGELLGLCGSALCQLFPTRGRTAGSKDPFHLESGPGAQAAADAVLASIRILGLRAPDLFLAEDAGPPFSLVFPGSLRLLVGRSAVKKPMPAPELRFFAGRALFTQTPDLLALRSLSVEELTFGLQTVGVALFGGKKVSEEAWTVREVLSPKVVPRLKEIFERAMETLDLDSLAEGARHSSNRAGLIVAGAVAPALGALRAKKALDAEIAELVRFAASERYLHLRARRIPG